MSKYLGEIEAENLGLSIGSYPFQKKNGEFCCRITFESRDLDLTETGLTKFLSQIPEDWVEDIRESYPSGKELDV